MKKLKADKSESYAGSVMAVAEKEGLVKVGLQELAAKVLECRKAARLTVEKNHQRKVWGALFKLRNDGKVSMTGKNAYVFNAARSKESSSTEPLCYRYRPGKLKDVVGQNRIKALLKAYLNAGRPPQHILCVGPSGTGKSSLAFALCGELGIGEFDFHLIKAQDCHVQDVDEIERSMHLSCWHSGGRYKLYLVDEAHAMTEKAKDRWLSTLERLPENRIVMFTTTKPLAFDLVWRSRCKVLDFQEMTAGTIASHLKRIARAEGDGVLDCKKIAKDSMAEYGGNLRAAMQKLEDELMILKSGMELDRPELER